MKAIIPAAGHGTRFLPVTKAVPKEMLPIGAKPALELIVEEARRAGADEIILVISEGKELIRKYFEDQPDITFVYQREQRGLGHAVLQAAGACGCGKMPHLRWGGIPAAPESDDIVLILLGDAVVLGCDASSEMVALTRRCAPVSGARVPVGVIGCEHVPPEKVSRYGILKVEGRRSEADGAGRIVDLVEKPKPEDAPSDLAIAGRYLLPTAIFDYLADQEVGVGGEIQLTDAIRRMLQVGRVASMRRPPEAEGRNDGIFPAASSKPPYQTNGDKTQPSTSTFNLLAYPYPGKRQDIGNPEGYFKALKEFYANR